MQKVESKDDINPRNLALIQKWIQLQNIWKSQQNSRPPRPRTTSFDHHLLLQSSPRTLMSSLQHRIPNCSDAVEEILMDRRAAIISGRFKGRQLFAAEESSLSHTYSGGDGDTCSDWVEERQVMANCDGCGEKYELSSPNFGESCPLPVVEAEKEKRDGGDGRREEKGGRRKAATASLGAVLIVLAFVLCFLSCYGNNVEELILVPT